MQRAHRHYGQKRSGSSKRLIVMAVFAIILFTVIFGIAYLVFFWKGGGAVGPEKIPAEPDRKATGNLTGICGDECLIALAIKNADSAYCRNVSNARLDECWQLFSNSELSSCLELGNYALRKTCVEDFAFFGKNASLCELLAEEDRAGCVEKINPPCMDIATQAEREKCLALRYNDSNYCSTAECALTYARERNDSSACARLASEPEKYACISTVEESNTCSLLYGANADYCYALLSQYSGDFSYCDAIASDLYKFKCYLAKAIEENDPSFCKKSPLEYMWECYKNYSLTTGSLEGCLEIDATYATGSRDGCINTYALEFAEPAACNRLSTIYMRTNCYANIILQQYNLTVQKCSGVSQSDWKDKCFTSAAMASGNSSVCGYISGEDERKRCVQNFERK